MSNGTPTRDRRTADESGERGRLDESEERGRLERLAPTAAEPIRIAGFWTAIVLPFLYVPLLVTGLSSSGEASAFLGLLGANVLALYVGRFHHR